jgi:hypothetical protein
MVTPSRWLWSECLIHCCGACPRSAGPGCCAARRATDCGRRLAPDGRPSLTQYGQAGWSGGDDDGSPFPALTVPLNASNALKCSQRLDRRASRCAWCHVGRGAAAARELRCRLRFAAPPAVVAARAPGVPPRSPQLRPRRITRGTCGGIFKGGGPGNWLTASAAENPTHLQPLPVREGAHPPPARGRERGVRAEGSVCRNTRTVSGWSFC